MYVHALSSARWTAFYSCCDLLLQFPQCYLYHPITCCFSSCILFLRSVLVHIDQAHSYNCFMMLYSINISYFSSGTLGCFYNHCCYWEHWSHSYKHFPLHISKRSLRNSSRNGLSRAEGSLCVYVCMALNLCFNFC